MEGRRSKCEVRSNGEGEYSPLRKRAGGIHGQRRPCHCAGGIRSTIWFATTRGCLGRGAISILEIFSAGRREQKSPPFQSRRAPSGGSNKTTYLRRCGRPSERRRPRKQPGRECGVACERFRGQTAMMNEEEGFAVRRPIPRSSLSFAAHLSSRVIFQSGSGSEFHSVTVFQHIATRLRRALARDSPMTARQDCGGNGRGTLRHAECNRGSCVICANRCYGGPNHVSEKSAGNRDRLHLYTQL